MDHAVARIWLERVAGKIDVDAPDLSGSVEDAEKRNAFLQQSLTGPVFDQTKDSIQALLRSLQLTGDEKLNVKVLTNVEEDGMHHGVMELEWDSHADDAGRVTGFVQNGEAIDPTSDAGEALITQVGATMQPLMDLSAKMAAAVDHEGKPLFTDRQIEAELWTPLMRQGVIPSNLVPPKYSETERAFREGTKVYKRLMEDSDGRSMGKDKIGFGLRVAKHVVKGGKVLGGEVLRYVDADIVEASRQDFAQFINSRDGVKMSDEDLKKAEAVRELAAGEALGTDGAAPHVDGDIDADKLWEDNKGALKSEYGFENKEDFEAAIANEKGLSKLEDWSTATGNGTFSDETLDGDKGSIAEMVHEEYDSSGGDKSYGDWLEGKVEDLEEKFEDQNKEIEEIEAKLEDDSLSKAERADLDQDLTEAKSAAAATEHELDGYNGAKLMQDYGEHVRNKAMLNIVGTTATMAVEAAEKIHKRQARRDVAEGLALGAIDIINSAVTFGTSAEKLTLTDEGKQQSHEQFFTGNAAKAGTKALTKLTHALDPKNKDRRAELLKEFALDVITASGEACAATGDIGEKKDGETYDSRGERMDYGLIIKASGAVMKGIDKLVAAGMNGDPKALIAQMIALTAAGPACYYAGELGDVTRIDREMDDIDEGTDDLFDIDGSGNIQFYATSPFDEISGAGGQTDFGMSGHRATINDQRAVIDDTLELMDEIGDRKKNKKIKDVLANSRKKLAEMKVDVPPDVSKWLDVEDVSENPDALKQALIKVKHLLEDALQTSDAAAAEQDAKLVDSLSDNVDKAKLKTDMDALDDFLKNATTDDLENSDFAEKQFLKIQEEITKDVRVMAELQSQLQSDERRIEALKVKANMVEVHAIEDETERRKRHDEALSAITELTNALNESEKTLKLWDQGTKGVMGIALAAAPGAGLAMKIRNMGFSIAKAAKRHKDLKLWKQQMEDLDQNYSVYGYVAKGEENILTKAHVHDSVDAAADAMGVVAEAMRLADQTHMTAAAATTIEKGTKALNEIWFAEYTEHKIRDGWRAFKNAKKDPQNRRAAREAMEQNSTFGKCILAYGACIDGDGQALRAMERLGLTEDRLRNKSDVCDAVVQYLIAKVMDSEFETIADQEDMDWMPCKAAVSMSAWLQIKGAARNLDPELSKSTYNSPKVDTLIDELLKANTAFLDADKAHRTAMGESMGLDDNPANMQRLQDAVTAAEHKILDLKSQLVTALRAYAPKDEQNKPHERMIIARDEMALAAQNFFN